jgi:hypothetical protein
MPNPNPSPETRFKTNRSEPLSSKVTIRVTDSMLEQLKMRDDYREFIRQAIAEKLQQSDSICQENLDISRFQSA